VSDNTYGGTFRLFDKVLTRYGLTFSYVDTSQLDQIEAAITPQTRMLFLETPTNPVLRLTDIAAASEAAHARGAFVVVDNTFASPYVQRPLQLGADIVLHSTTKFLNGHSDSVGGVVVAQRDDQIEWLRFEPDSPVTGPVRTQPHVAYKVPSIEKAAAGLPTLIEPFTPLPNLRVGL